MAQSLEVLKPSELDRLRTKAKRNLYFFTKAILGYDWLNTHIHLPVCQLLQAKENTRVKIILPRTWLKSTICTIAFPLWEAIRNPNIRVLIAQNTHTNACKKLAEIRAQLESNVLLRALFSSLIPDRRSKDVIWRADALQLVRSKPSPEATFEAAGTRTKVTSRHYDIIIEDDTVAPDLDDLTSSNVMPSRDDVQQAIGWHRLVPPLLVDLVKGQNIVVGTRWYQEDLLSWIGENEPYFKSYERAIFETDGVPDERGEAIYPERFSHKIADQLKMSMGPYLFSCLYMNKPIRSDDMIFQPEWMKYYDVAPRSLMTYTSVDSAGDPEDTKGKPDYNVVMTCGKDLVTGYIYVLDYFRERCSVSEMIDAIFSHARKYKPVQVLVETVAYQSTILYWVRDRMRKEDTHFMMEGITHGRIKKNARIQGLQPIFASGSLFLLPWMKDLEQELLAFPFGANDDLPDALSMQLESWLLTQGKKEIKDREAKDDPRSLQAALDRIHARQRRHPRMLVGDLLNMPRNFGEYSLN